jgi:hypothetical protein
MSNLGTMLVAFVPAITRVQRQATEQIALAACRGDTATVALWRERHDAWLAVVARVKKLTPARTSEQRAALADELARAMAMTKGWSA